MNQVLVVDESRIIRRLVEVSLGQIRLEVSGVSTGAEACDALLREVPDLLILDVGLSDVSGWDVLEFVRSRPELSDVAVIMMTRSTGNGVPDRRTGEADAYLPKPYRPTDLRRVVVDTIHKPVAPTP